MASAAADLYWLPLGAGGRFVRMNGRIYEACDAAIHRRNRCDLYHSALEVQVPGGRFVIEQTPVPDRHGDRRGVVAEGAVGSRRAARLRIFRYEVRRWRDGVIPDVREAIDSPRRLTGDVTVAAATARSRSVGADRPPGDGTSCAQARCGTPTRSSRGSSSRRGSTRRTYVSPRTAGHPDGTRASWSRHGPFPSLSRDAAGRPTPHLRAHHRCPLRRGPRPVP